MSADLAPYQAEIDASLSPDEVEFRAKTSKAYARAWFTYPVLVRYFMRPWRRQSWPMCVAPFLGTRAFRAEHLRISILQWIVALSPRWGNRPPSLLPG
jgi:hypothetical protein